MTDEVQHKVRLSDFVPLVFLLAYLGIIIYLRLRLPDAQEILRITEDLYRQFGYAIVLFSGFLEAMFLIGMYIPGSAAMLLGAVLAKSGATSFPLVILGGTTGLMLGYMLNYFLGRFGWYRVLASFGLEKGMAMAERKLKHHGRKALFLGYLAPNSGSFISTASGVLGIPFKEFFFVTLISQLFWSTLWGLIAYMVGNIFVELFLKYGVFVVYILIVVVLMREVVKRGYLKRLSFGNLKAKVGKKNR